MTVVFITFVLKDHVGLHLKALDVRKTYGTEFAEPFSALKD